MKRIVETSIALLLLLICLPVFVVCAIGSSVALRAWPFFSHTRVGRGGRPFRMIKIRTLRADTRPYADKFELDHAQIPAFTRALRRLHLDELPQLWLVVTGRMALVGPRPEMPFLHERMNPDFAELRTSVRPGCTGLWQISAHSVDLIDECEDYDVFYIRHRSFRLDAWIIGRTILLLLPGVQHRPISLDDVPSGLIERELPERVVASMAAGD